MTSRPAPKRSAGFSRDPRALRRRVLIVALCQLLLIPLAVWGQLSARVVGDEYRFRVAPADPLDPFRGAYVQLAYPDLARAAEPGAPLGTMTDGTHGNVYITLKRDGRFMVADRYLRQRPDTQPYLACDDHGWRISCGIDSWFLPEGSASALGRTLTSSSAEAIVKVDSRGHAALVEVRAPGT